MKTPIGFNSACLCLLASVAAPLLSPCPASAAGTSSTRLVNISARVAIGGDAGTPVTGFAISGNGGKSMLVRAVGPTLAQFGVGQALADPKLDIYQAQTLLGQNDNWLPADAQTMNSTGAFALTAGSKDAAFVSSLPSGSYTALVNANSGDSGIVLLEAYDASGTDKSSALVNASMRAYVGTGDSVLIAGFVLGGSGAQKVLLRAVGPALSNYKVSGFLADPSITLYRGSTVIASNDNWSTSSNASEIATATANAGAFSLASGSKDAALLASLTPDSYTAIVRGVGNTTGTALVELYLVNDTPSSAVFNLSQTTSDFAQQTTIAFSGLAMMTGNLESQSFFPPGKVADYTGFQYLRDNDPDNMGHNTSFLTRVANNVIYILNDTQFAKLKTLASAQLDQINLYGYKRFPLMKAFRRLLEGDLPSGSTGLNLNAVKKASRDLYLIDGQISYDRAVLYASLLNSLDATQKAYLESMKGKGWSSWPDISDSQIRAKMSGLPQGSAVAVMTYASDLFSWYAGSVEADVYFCPERQGTYYGSFYIKDAPAIGHEGYSIDEQLTATAGLALCDSSKGYVSKDQATLMSSLVETQRKNLYASDAISIVSLRTEIATLLRGLLLTGTGDETIKAKVLELSGLYGDLDGENNYNYATVFSQVYKSLGTEQKTKLAALRKSIMSGKYADGTSFDFSTCSTPFLYSSVISDASLLAPYTGNTDYLFFEP